MKVTGVSTYDLVIPNEVVCRPPWAPGREERARDFTLVIVRTDQGIDGIAGGNGHWSSRIDKAVVPYILGRDPREVESLSRHLRDLPGVWFLEIALWDIIGKVAKQPLYRLWGGRQRRLPAYASTAELGTPEERAEQAVRYASAGFKSMKMRVHAATLREDLAYVDAVLAATSLELMVDANQATLFLSSPDRGPQWDYARALRTAQELEDRGVVWLEEPLSRWAYEDLARLTANTRIYIAGGEKNPIQDLRQILAHRSYDIIQPDVTMGVSLSDAWRVKALCEEHGLHFMPHHGVSGIGLAATLHMLSAYEGWTYVEYMYDPPYRTIETYQCLGGIITTPILLEEDGCVVAPDRPGIGLEIDEGMIRQYDTKVGSAKGY
jgi:L-alanine-DL-glutamate epimerase-like enolase superfamily enzyme